MSVEHRFTSQEFDAETGLYYYNARYYNPALGRFISADVIVPNPADPQSLNRYSYVGNNPIVYIDPTGRSRFSKAFSKFMDNQLGIERASVGLYAVVGGEVNLDFRYGHVKVGGAVGVGVAVKVGVSTPSGDIFVGHGAAATVGYDPYYGPYTSVWGGCTLCGGASGSATYYFRSGTYQVGAGYGFGNMGVGVGYSNAGGTTIGAGYGGLGLNYGLQTHKTRYSIGVDDRDLKAAYKNGVDNRHGNGTGAENGNRTFNSFIDFLGTVTAGYEAFDNHDDGYGTPGANEATVNAGLLKDMVHGALSNITQPAGLVRAAIGLAISPIYYGAVTVGGGPAYRAAQGGGSTLP